ncbi:MAG TPA: preprotein translocase subunit SecY [bacterium]|nr:preprotein translocase subunit SecY [bacterium]
MWDKLKRIWKLKDLRNSILFVLGMLVVYRFAAHIPIPGINFENLNSLLNSNQALGFLDLFSGGGIRNFSIMMLGVAPYITASIIVQLLTMIVPKLEALSKEGEYGRKKINSYTRWLTIPLAVVQTFSMISVLRNSPYQVIDNMSSWSMFLAVIAITSGTVFLMWLGELISEKKIGNGISLLIFVGIVSALPGTIQSLIINFDKSQILNLVLFGIIAIATVVGVVFITQGQRNIPISYTRHMSGSKVYGGVNTHLPLRVNQAGVIPIIFAIAMMMFPPMIASLFINAKTAWIASFATSVNNLWSNQIFYTAMYFILVIAFTYFYTSVIFHPDKISDNLQKQGGFIPGIRPGRETANYLHYVSNRILLLGAVFLGLIAVLPFLIQVFFSMGNVSLGGTSLLIVVSVVIEIIKQIQAQLVMRDYDQV